MPDQQDCKMAIGLIPHDCRSAVAGVGIAPPPVTKNKRPRRTSSNPSAISVTPAVAVGRPHSVRGMPSASQFQHRLMSRQIAVSTAITRIGAALASSQLCLRAQPSPVEHGELEFDLGQEAWLSRMLTHGFKKWRNVFWNRI